MTDQPPEDVNKKAQTSITKAKEEDQEAQLSIRDLVQKRAVEMYTSEKGQEFVSALTSATDRNAKIKNCSPSSIITSMMACIMLDLVPETGQQLAYLIPYGNILQFQIGYKGLIELAYRSGMVLSINAELVFPEDEFDFNLGTNRGIMHRPNMSIDRTNFGGITQVYATAELKDGGTVFEVMSISELEKIRATVKAKSTDAPWKTWPEQMAKKTVIKRLTKYMPQSKTDNRIHEAVRIDSLAEVGKLKFQDGEFVENKEPVEAVDNKLELKPLAKPIVVESTKAPVEQEEANYENEDVSEHIVIERSDEEYRKDIEDMIEFLALKQTETMRLFNEHGKSPFLKNIKKEGLKRIYDDLKETADAKTQYLAEKLDQQKDDVEDSAENVLDKFPGAEKVN